MSANPDARRPLESGFHTMLQPALRSAATISGVVWMKWPKYKRGPIASMPDSISHGELVALDLHGVRRLEIMHLVIEIIVAHVGGLTKGALLVGRRMPRCPKAPA